VCVPRQPPFTEVVSAEGRRALAGSENRSSDVGEGEMLGRAACALFPVEKELAVAVGQAGSGVDVEFGQRAIDPLGRAFCLGVGADRGLVDEQVRGGVGVRADRVRPLRPVLFVGEDGDVTHLSEYFGQRFAFGDDGFGLDADLVARRVDWSLLVGQAFVRHRAQAAVLADAKHFAPCAQVAVGSVVQSVVFVGPGSDEMKSELGKAGLEGL
jgi:hypothetical protein